jgi:hypothetical protein
MVKGSIKVIYINNGMKFVILLLSLFFLGCQTTPTNPEFWMEKEINSCLPTAIIFKQSLRKYDVWADVFRYSWKDSQTGKLRGHAMVAYLYPPGKNQLFTYDTMGSWNIRAYTNDITSIAQISHTVRGGKEKIFNASWIK